MASGLRPGAASARATSAEISASRVPSTRPSASPSWRRIFASSASAASKPLVTAACAAARSSSRSSASATSITPLMARMPSSRAGSASMRPASEFKVAITALSTSSLTLTTGATPSRSTLSVPCSVPRATTSPARARNAGSIASQPGGRRSRRSSPLALTERISHAHP